MTNEYLAELLQAHGAPAVVVPDVPIEFEQGGVAQDGMEAFSVVCVTSFDRDEPVSAMAEAARELPDIRFFMTGDRTLALQALPQGTPANLVLTGFLDNASYGALVRHAGVVVALTTDDHTMQRGAYEAIYHGTPVIVSDTDLLRRAFDEGAVHVDNSPASIVAAVRRVRDHASEYRAGAARLRARKHVRWTQSRSALLETIGHTHP